MCNLIRRLLTIIFLLIFGFAFGQDFSYPSINNQGKDLNSFIPNGWTLLDSTQGDLNKDNHKDLVFIIQHKDSVTIIKNYFDYNDTVLTQPRILIILFYNQTTNQFQLVEQNNSFILNHDNPNMEDPYQDISIDNGVLKIGFHIFMNMGSWRMSDNSYKFHYQDDKFFLFGADYNSVDRGSGETEDRSYNFLTKRVKVATGTIESDKQKIVWRTIELTELKTIKTFKQPFIWEVEKDYYL
jgi:hypothetical protein